MLESALALPYATFGGVELYPSINEKTAAMGYSLLKNHGFIDGNIRIAVAAMDVFLLTNGYSLNIATDEDNSPMSIPSAIKGFSMNFPRLIQRVSTFCKWTTGGFTRAKG